MLAKRLRFSTDLAGDVAEGKVGDASLRVAPVERCAERLSGKCHVNRKRGCENGGIRVIQQAHRVGNV